MLNLKQLTDDQLLADTEKLVQRERVLLTDILNHLKEIDRRRLFSKLKYSSLYDYATKHLGYSEDQAYRRIQAMRLLRELPEIETKINDGSLCLSHLGLAQSLFKNEEKSQNTFSKEKKVQLLEKLKNTSKREAEKIALSHATNSTIFQADKIRIVSEKNVEIRFIAKEELCQKIERLKGLLAHSNPNIGLSELFDQLCDLGLDKWDPLKKQMRKISSEQKQEKSVVNETVVSKTALARKMELRTQASMSLARVKTEVWKRDNGKCQNCGSQYAIEIDHCIPKALGGDNSKDNLRLLCRTCNQRAAINIFGLSKMQKYIKKAQ